MHKTHTRRSVMAGAAASAVVLSATRVGAAEPTVHEVAIKAFEFDPPQVQARIGDKIRWTNHDLAPHTATADEFGWDTEEITKGESGEIIVTEGMETSYFCVFHQHMKGTIEIV